MGFSNFPPNFFLQILYSWLFYYKIMYHNLKEFTQIYEKFIFQAKNPSRNGQQKFKKFLSENIIQATDVSNQSKQVLCID